MNEQCLDIHYQGFNSPNKNVFTVSPYYLKQYNNRWFLFGHNHKEEKIQNLALDRIKEIQASKKRYEPCEIDFDEYFEDIIGVTNNQEQQPAQIVIELSNNIKPYILSKPIHGSQNIKGNLLKLELKLNYELESVILSFGENMKVLEPKKLKEIIKNRLQEVNKNY